MKKVAILLALAVLITSSVASAVDIPASKITITAQPVDYVPAMAGIAQPVSKTYVANERFAALVSITVPNYMDTSNMTLEVAPKGCTVDNLSALALATGDYLITGTILTSGATIKITAKDTALDTASTANELWAALYGDRTVSATVTLGGAEAAQPYVGIPKTGGRVEIITGAGYILLAIALYACVRATSGRDYNA